MFWHIALISALLSLVVGCTTKIAIGEDNRTYWISPWRYWSEFREREALYRQWALEATNGTADQNQMIIKRVGKWRQEPFRFPGITDRQMTRAGSLGFSTLRALSAPLTGSRPGLSNPTCMRTPA